MRVVRDKASKVILGTYDDGDFTPIVPEGAEITHLDTTSEEFVKRIHRESPAAKGGRVKMRDDGSLEIDAPEEAVGLTQIITTERNRVGKRLELPLTLDELQMAENKLRGT